MRLTFLFLVLKNSLRIYIHVGPTWDYATQAATVGRIQAAVQLIACAVGYVHKP